MARVFSITSQASVTDNLLDDLKKEDKIFQLQLFKGASVQPEGDIIQVTIPNRHINRVMRLLDQYKLGQQGGISLTSSDPAGYIPTSSSHLLERDMHDSSWEEIEMILINDSNSSPHLMVVMFLAGMITTFGLATNVLHIVIGGMLITAGFMPIARMAMGAVAGNKTWKFGLLDYAKGYSLLILGASIATILLKPMGFDPLNGSAGYYELSQQLSTYFTTFTIPSILTSLAAGISGAVILATKKTLFASGVMIGLALIPSASITGIAAVSGQWQIMSDAFARFIADTAIVLISSGCVFLWLRYYSMKRKSAM